MRELLDTLRRESLYTKFTMCEFWLREVQFLGYLINHNGILVDQAKVEVVMRWEFPKSPSETRSFLGLVEGYGILLGD